MNTFKTFFKVMSKSKGTVILYTAMLIIFGGLNIETNNNAVNFEAEKPDIYIIDKDNSNLSNNLVDYLKDKTNIVEIQNDEESINDAVFYRDVSYVLYIPENYGNNLINGIDTSFDIKSSDDYESYLSEMIINRYINVSKIYSEDIKDENKLIKKINATLEEKTKVEIKSKLNTSVLTKASFFYNFLSYSIMAAIIFIVTLILYSFHEDNTKKRLIISGTDYKKINADLLKASFVYSLVVWALYVVLSIVLVGDTLLSLRGLIYMINALIFTFVSLTISILISTIVKSNNAISGMVNVIALGSAFLCGVFVPAEWLPSSVLTIAHILPTYYYVNTNDLLKTIEVLDLNALMPIIINMIILIIFAIVFIIINTIISKKKQRIG